jgi:spermidine synthase
VVIDSTDHAESVAEALFTQSFYVALHALMAPRAALIQQYDTFDREFSDAISKTKAMMTAAGWDDVFTSLVYTPAYSGETVFMQAVKREV